MKRGCLEIRQRGEEMNSFELFTMIFFTLDAYWDEHKGEELGQFLSSMNPFLFDDIGSAVSDIYNDFCGWIDGKEITIDSSYMIAQEYIDMLDKDYLKEAFAWIDTERWRESCQNYLSEPHKGEVI